MTYEEHTKIIQDIAKNLSDQGAVTTLLTQLSSDYKDVVEQNNQLSNTVTESQNAITKLKEDNMNLFLRVGQPTPEPTPQPTPKEDVKLKYEDLFDEKGGLK